MQGGVGMIADYGVIRTLNCSPCKSSCSMSGHPHPNAHVYFRGFLVDQKSGMDGKWWEKKGSA